MKYLMLIPARGGSVGIKGKNMRPVGGVPLVARAIRTARRAVATGEINARIVCSTDNAAIADCARSWGAEALDRPASLATDTAPIVDVVLHALDAYPDCEAVCLLQPTSPFTGADDIRYAINQSQGLGVPVVSVCDCDHPPEWDRMFDPLGRVREYATYCQGARRQDLLPGKRVNGAIYVITAARLREERRFVTIDAQAYEMPIERSVDIDTPRDLYLADMYIRHVEPQPVKIAEVEVGPHCGTFIVAECACNHQGDVTYAMQMIDAAVEAGCDAVKFQSFRSEMTLPPDGARAMKPLELDMRAHVMLKAYAEKKNLIFLSTPFDEWSADMLEDIGIHAYKISSGDITHLPLLRHIARKGKPVILSTGASNVLEIDRALDELQGVPVILMHCTSLYPAQAGQMNLRAMETMQAAFGRPVGLSDHSIGISASVAAVAMGACAVEKHITPDPSWSGADHAISLPTTDLAVFCRAIREVELARGPGNKIPFIEEDVARVNYRRGLYAAADIAEGEQFTDKNILARRPLNRVPVSDFWSIINTTAKKTYKAGEAI